MGVISIAMGWAASRAWMALWASGPHTRGSPASTGKVLIPAHQSQAATGKLEAVKVAGCRLLRQVTSKGWASVLWN